MGVAGIGSNGSAEAINFGENQIGIQRWVFEPIKLEEIQ